MGCQWSDPNSRGITVLVTTTNLVLSVKPGASHSWAVKGFVSLSRGKEELRGETIGLGGETPRNLKISFMFNYS